MAKFMKKSLMCTLALVLLLTSVPFTAKAATSMLPYSYSWTDSSTSKIVHQFYEYNNSKNTFSITKRVSSKGNYIYNSNDELIFAESKGSSVQYIGFDEKGTLLVIAKDGSIYGSSNLKVFLQLVKNVNATSFNYSIDDLIVSVQTTSGTLSVSSFKLMDEAVIEETEQQTETPVVNKVKNRIEQTENSAGEMVYTAFKNGKSYMTIIVKNAKVLNVTANVRLSDNLVGAKFLGIDESYNVYMYENNGSLYRFKYGSWYSAQKIALNGNFRSCSRNENGFISSITTTQKTYSIKQLTTDSKWKASRTYAVNKGSYSTMYIKGSAKSNTLSIKDKVLTLNGKTVAKNVSKFYFVNKKSFIYSKGSTLYKATLNKPKSVSKVTTKLKKVTLKNGLAKKVVLKSGKSIKLG